MKVRGYFLVPPHSKDKTTLIKLIDQLTTNPYIYRKCGLVHDNIRSVEQFVVMVKHYLYTSHVGILHYNI